MVHLNYRARILVWGWIDNCKVFNELRFFHMTKNYHIVCQIAEIPKLTDACNDIMGPNTTDYTETKIV
jgi:hypothetical protein